MTSTELPAHPRKDRRFVLSVIVPCYNEEAVIRLTHATLLTTLGEDHPFDLEIVYVNDGSTDGTPAILDELAAGDRRVKVVSFSRNFGHQPAISAGFTYADGDVAAVIDADLQDPPEVILRMLERWRDGYDVVYGIRAKRKEGPFKRFAYAGFYRMFKSISDVDVPLDAGDFGLVDRRVVDILNSLPETNRYVRGLRAWAGHRQTGVVYERAARAAGETKYPLRKLLRLAFDGIFNFSTTPLNLVFATGIGTAILATIGLLFILLQRLFGITIYGVAPQDVPGFASLALMILFIGGVQMVSVGILGQYIGRIYTEVKRRPAYVVRDVQSAAGTAGPDSARPSNAAPIPPEATPPARS